ncbi:hypothetical protein C0995_001769, partial [Termitomyces sp. Mi166
ATKHAINALDNQLADKPSNEGSGGDKGGLEVRGIHFTNKLANRLSNSIER